MKDRFIRPHLFAFNPPVGVICPKCRRRMKIQVGPRGSSPDVEGKRFAVCRPCGVMLVSQGKIRPPAANPPRGKSVQIYQPTRGVVIQGMQKPPGHPCDARCAAAGHKYRHRFKTPVEIIGKPNGEVLLRGRTRRR